MLGIKVRPEPQFADALEGLGFTLTLKPINPKLWERVGFVRSLCAINLQAGEHIVFGPTKGFG